MKLDMFDTAACGRFDQVKLVLRGSLRYTPYSKLAAVDFPTFVLSLFPMIGMIYVTAFTIHMSG